MSLLYIQKIDRPLEFDNFWFGDLLTTKEDYERNCYKSNFSLYYPFLEQDKNKYNNFYIQMYIKRLKITDKISIFQEKLLPHNIYGKY